MKELLNEIVSPHEMEVIFENMRNQPNNDFELALMNGLKPLLNVGSDENINGERDHAGINDDESTKNGGKKKETATDPSRDITEADPETMENTKPEVTDVTSDVSINHDEL